MSDVAAPQQAAVVPAAAAATKKTASTTATATTKKAKNPRAKPSHPPTSEMVNGAIRSLKERGGSSLQAIKKYVAANYKIDAEKLSPFIKKYLKAAVASDILVQTKGKGASGSFKLAATSTSKKGAAGDATAQKPQPTRKVTKTLSSSPTGKKATASDRRKKSATERKRTATAKAKKTTTAEKRTVATPAAKVVKPKSPSKAKKATKGPTKKPKAPKPKTAKRPPASTAKAAASKKAVSARKK